MTVSASAVAHATVNGAATAIAVGASQQGLSGGLLSLTFDNSGSLAVAAAARASGGARAGPGALAVWCSHPAAAATPTTSRTASARRIRS